MDPYATLGELGAGLRSGAWSSVELTRFYLDRSRSLNPVLNAFITLAEDHALELAARADKRLRQGDATSLTGIPIAAVYHRFRAVLFLDALGGRRYLPRGFPRRFGQFAVFVAVEARNLKPGI